MKARLGVTYHPKGTTDYAYVVVRLDREGDRIECFILWSPCSDSSKIGTGKLFDEPLSEFEDMLKDGEIKRFVPQMKRGKPLS